VGWWKLLRGWERWRGEWGYWLWFWFANFRVARDSTRAACKFPKRRFAAPGWYKSESATILSK